MTGPKIHRRTPTLTSVQAPAAESQGEKGMDVSAAAIVMHLFLVCEAREHRTRPPRYEKLATDGAYRTSLRLRRPWRAIGLCVCAAFDGSASEGHAGFHRAQPTGLQGQ